MVDMAGRSAVLLAVLACVVLASARRLDQDFEFDDDAAQTLDDGDPPRKSHRYHYDPNNPLCSSLQCVGREQCVLRDEFTALCAEKEKILRNGDSWVESPDRPNQQDDDDVFYDADPSLDHEKPDRCVECEAGSSTGGFVCGSDNRTYSSLCRLDLHNCVSRARPPVQPACAGFCPCRRPHRRNNRVDQRRTRLGGRNSNSRSHERISKRKHDKINNSNNNIDGGALARQSCSMERMADRLLDWFSVLMDEAAAIPPAADGFPRDCKPEVRWMFAHLDIDGDGLLSSDNLYALRHDDRERCLRPFLASCSVSGGGVSRGAWCACLRRAARPCTALARAHPHPHTGAYVPACDARGFYRPRQCHPALGVCWCVTAHGQEVSGTRTRGAPACPEEHPEPEPEAGAPADDEDAGGSGDGSDLRF